MKKYIPYAIAALIGFHLRWIASALNGWSYSMNGADITREKAKTGQQTDKEVQRLRESCITLLELLDDPEAVRGILLYASRLYSRQERRKPQEGRK